MSDIGGLQLLPETRKKIEIRIPGQNRLLTFGIILLLLVAGLYLWLLSYKGSLFSSISAIDEQLLAVEKSRDKDLEKKILDLNKQLSVINPLLTSHSFWSFGLGQIQSVSLPQVQYQSINADFFSKKIVITVIARDLTTIARRIAALYTLPSVTDITLNKISSQSAGTIQFILQINFDTSKFLIK